MDMWGPARRPDDVSGSGGVLVLERAVLSIRAAVLRKKAAVTSLDGAIPPVPLVAAFFCFWDGNVVDRMAEPAVSLDTAPAAGGLK